MSKSKDSDRCIKCGASNWRYKKNGRRCRPCQNEYRKKYNKEKGLNSGPRKLANYLEEHKR